MNAYSQIDSQLYWIAALVAMISDTVFIFALARRIGINSFTSFRWSLAIAALIFWAGIWSWVMWDPFLWRTCYAYVWPPWARIVVPPAFSMLNGCVALVLWWIAQRIPGNPVVYFCLMGGIESFPGHLWAIFQRKILETPLLQNISAPSALTFGFFEYSFYWCIILTIASVMQWLLRKVSVHHE